jgi:DNA invertase Pin-like site-specific DNA recombinase
VKAALYVRVSTTDRQHPDMQMGELREYCRRRGWEIAGEYTDAGISGAKEKRPQLDRMLAECRARKVDAVVVWRYDRFARSLKQLVNALDDFRTLGIEFVSIHDGCDTTTAQGRLMFGIMASLAEFERELIRERVRAGLDAARARGKRLGRPRCDVDRKRIAELRAQGRSWRAIARELKVGVATARAAFPGCAKNPSPPVPVSV